MKNDERIRLLQEAMDHQYDTDENADLAIETADPVLLAAVRLVNEFGGWSEISIAPYEDLFRAIGICQGQERRGSDAD